MTKTQTVSFWTTGENMKGLLLDLFESGEFHAFNEIVKDSEVPESVMKDFWLHKFELNGDTRTEEGISIKILEESPHNYAETLYTSIKSALRTLGDYDIFDIQQNAFVRNSKNIKVLLEHINLDEIYENCRDQILVDEGFEITELSKAVVNSDEENQHQSISGILLQDGRFVQCGYQQHMYLLPILSRLGYIHKEIGRDRVHDGVEISSNCISLGLGFDLQKGGYRRSNGYKLSIRQIEEIFKAKNFIKNYYSTSYGSNNVKADCLKAYANAIGNGAKYGNLKFLEKFYPQIKLPTFYRELPHECFEKHDRIFIRTSPEKSMPGILHSKLATKETYHKCIAEIVQDYKGSQDIAKTDSFKIFFQEFLEGDNGVSIHNAFSNSKHYEFEYSISSEQGAIVNGKVSKQELNVKHIEELEKIGNTLSSDFSSKIQLEFVIHNDELYIVQLRILSAKPNWNTKTTEELEKALVSGKTFNAAPEYNHNSFEIDVNEILVVENEGDSNLLIGKKALIVTDDIAFSHLLALSIALDIPSIYATGDVSELFKHDRVRFDTSCIQGVINIIK